ncbi:hypothetical protein [Bradyrhizobium sp. 1200_D9_N1_1]|uniref:hypothetical protein n=1 Tax=Bradyrhizobium sp. 1200_D9_N1_1 TaxID=3239013 RepID=UPI003F8C8E04
MKPDLLTRLGSLKWNVVNSRPIAGVPWSAIRRIGHSRLLSLTIAIPFLGSLLLFNQYVVDVLTLSPDLVRRWVNIPESGAAEAARQLTLSRLYYVYFGLTFLGFGSALFTLFCPQMVKDYASPTECVQAESAIVTPSRIALSVSAISTHYLVWSGDDPLTYKMSDFVRRAGWPIDFTNLCYVAILEVFNDVPPALFPAREESPPTESTQSDDASSLNPDEPFYDLEGRPDPIAIAQSLVSGRRLVQWFVRAFGKAAATEGHRNDMLTLHYMALDHSEPRLRLLVCLFFAIGFALLAIPTVLTFVRLASHMIR